MDSNVDSEPHNENGIPESDVNQFDTEDLGESNIEPRNETPLVSNEEFDSDAFIDSLVDAHLSKSKENDSLPESEFVDDTPVDVNDSEGLQDSLQDSISKPSLKPDKLCQLPLGSVKRIVKSDPDVTVVSAESIFLIAKATEFFLQWLGKEVHTYTVRQKKKTIQVRDLNAAIAELPALRFLDGALD